MTIQEPYPTLALQVLAIDADMVSGILWTGEPLGVEEEEHEGGVTLRAYWNAASVPQGLVERLTDAGFAPRPGLLEPWDWFRPFRDAFVPFAPVPGVIVRPPWAAPPPGQAGAAAVVDIVVEPGAAFGTGLHESTRLALALLAPIIDEGTAFLDIGAGSGILSCYAALRGARALALENDPGAMENLCANRAANGLGSRLRVVCGAPACLRSSWDVVAANLTYEALAGLESELSRLTSPAGALVLSGILVEHREGARALASRLGRLEREESMGAWMAIGVRR